ncbi:MAG: hypothetical protein ACOH1I_10185 [Gallionellaceae bacterium]
MPGAKIVLQDNRFVAGNSLAIIGQDKDCNTYKSRTLSDGTEHCALKNFPCEAELRELVSDLSIAATYKTWQYYWALICNAIPSNPPSPFYKWGNRQTLHGSSFSLRLMQDRT